MIVNEDRRFLLDRAEQNIPLGVVVFALVPMQDRAQFAAVVAEAATGRSRPLIDAETMARWVIADMTGLDDDEILAVMGVGSVPIRRDLPPTRPWSNGKTPKCCMSRTTG